MKYVLTFIKSFIFSFLLTYFAIDVWRLATTPTLTTNHSCSTIMNDNHFSPQFLPNP